MKKAVESKLEKYDRMKTFVIPSWHPTPTKPLWCNWVLPHIALLRDSGIETYVLQLGLDDEPIPEGTDPWRQPIRLLSEHHLYVPVPQPEKPYQRSRFFYGRWLDRYVGRMREVYRVAVEQWGRPDILHAHVSLPGGYVAAGLGEEHNIPVIVQEHYSGFESDARFPWRVGFFIQEMGRRIQGFYAVSPGQARKIEATGLVNVTGVLPNPVDTVLFSLASREMEDKPFQIVTAGNMSMVKGSDVLFEALHQLMPKLDWRLTLFGDASQKQSFVRWLDDPQFLSRLTLPGRVPQKELADAYSKSDLYVVSSRLEMASVSMVQAMACGLPVVTTSCGASETLIDDTVGVAVKANDPKALASGIVQVAQNRERYDPAGQRQFIIDRHSKPVVAKKVRKTYEKAILRAANLNAIASPKIDPP